MRCVTCGHRGALHRKYPVGCVVLIAGGRFCTCSKYKEPKVRNKKGPEGERPLMLVKVEPVPVPAKPKRTRRIEVKPVDPLTDLRAPRARDDEEV